MIPMIYCPVFMEAAQTYCCATLNSTSPRQDGDSTVPIIHDNSTTKVPVHDEDKATTGTKDGAATFLVSRVASFMDILALTITLLIAKT